MLFTTMLHEIFALFGTKRLQIATCDKKTYTRISVQYITSYSLIISSVYVPE